jgi:hypothetical protein
MSVTVGLRFVNLYHLSETNGPARSRTFGCAQLRVDIPEKVSGKAVFAFDVKLPDLHYGRTDAMSMSPRRDRH